MIAYLKGPIAYKDAYGAIVDVQGVGYQLAMSTKSLATLPEVGESAMVWTYMQVKDDGISLFGFAQQSERELFNRLISVSGIGPKMAIAALSTYDAEALVQIIAAGDVTAISKVPGIGKKTAQRVVLELQGVLETVPTAVATAANSGAFNDAMQALVAMGFSNEEAAEALKGAPADADASALIRGALKSVGGR